MDRNINTIKKEQVDNETTKKMKKVNFYLYINQMNY